MTAQPPFQSRFACLRCGAVETPREGAYCPSCDEPVYDLHDDQDRAAAALGLQQRRDAAVGSLAMVLAVGMILGGVLLAFVHDAFSALIALWLLAIPIASLIYRSRQPPSLRAIQHALLDEKVSPIRFRVLTSAPMLLVPPVLAAAMVPAVAEVTLAGLAPFGGRYGLLLASTLALLLLGIPLDLRVGRVAFFLVLAGLFGGAAAAQAVSPSPDGVSGLAPLVYGVGLCAAVLLRGVPMSLMFYGLRVSASVPVLAPVVVFFYLICDVLFSLEPVAWAPRAACAATGLLLGFLLRFRPTPAVFVAYVKMRREDAEH